jgi:ADP-ribose pyrophosphatase YjhB (NUDIX family)
MIKIVTELQAIAQSGITYSQDKFDIERYKRILEISAELLSSNSNHKYIDVLELFTKDTGYVTPKVDVRGAVFKDNKILLIREKSDGLWSLPGGWADVNLSASENVLKEIKEESGYECKVIKLIGIYDKNRSNPPIKWPHVYKIFFLCEIIDGPYYLPFLSEEIHEIGFFKLSKIPKLSEERVAYHQIEKCFMHFSNRELESEFKS